jgi:hypothetical protein
MAELLFKGDHNKQAFLGRVKGDAHYVQMMEFLHKSHSQRIIPVYKHSHPYDAHE